MYFYLSIFNIQSATILQFITANFVGVFNAQWCKNMFLVQRKHKDSVCKLYTNVKWGI
jgi:hypothetical protein